MSQVQTQYKIVKYEGEFYIASVWPDGLTLEAGLNLSKLDRPISLVKRNDRYYPSVVEIDEKSELVLERFGRSDDDDNWLVIYNGPVEEDKERVVTLRVQLDWSQAKGLLNSKAVKAGQLGYPGIL